MWNNRLRFSLLLLALIHVTVESRFERDASDDDYFRQNVGKSRQINISGQINGLNDQNSVSLSLKCVENDELFPLIVEIYKDKIEFSVHPGNTIRNFTRKFKNERITIAITIFTNQFNIALVDSAGRFAHSFKPVEWFREGEDFAHKRDCRKREIRYTRDVFIHDAITVEPEKFIYTHHTPFMPGNLITFIGRIVQENYDFSIEIGSIDEELPKTLSLRMTRDKVVLKCSDRTKPRRKSSQLPPGDVLLEIRIYDTEFTVAVNHLQINTTAVKLRCPHGFALTNRNNLFIGPWSSIMAQSPLIDQLKTPVYVPRYKNESAYMEYKRITEEHMDYVMSTLSTGAFRYGFWIGTERWDIVSSYEGSIDFRFERLPYHFANCPCDCLSDYTSVVLMETMHDVHFEDTEILRTIVFYQWLDGHGVRFTTDNEFILEIFTISSLKEKECDWDDSEIFITSIREEFEEIDSDTLTESVFIKPTSITDNGIVIRYQDGVFFIDAYGELIEYEEKITFIQVFGLKNVTYIGEEGVLLS